MKKALYAMLFIITVSLLLFSACSKEYNGEKSAEKLLELCNEARNSHDLAELQINEELSRNAQTRAEEIADTGEFSHVRPDGRGCFTVLTVDYSYAGENLAKGDGNAEDIFNEWMASTEHKENILSASYTQTGFGCCEKDGTVYWVQLFIG